jgi:translation initiation factor 2 beta subunit (eIF-2beta)/eIF-5
MITTTPPRSLSGMLLFKTGTMAILMAIICSAQAQQPKKANQSTTTAPSQSNAKNGSWEIDGMTKVELEKAQLELERAQLELSKQDWKKMEAEMAQARAEMERAMQTAQVAYEKESIKKAMAEIDKTLAQQKGNIASEMKKAEGQIKKAHDQIRFLQEGMELLEKDGLIKPGESINIDWEGDIMILNGKKQSKEVSEKYRKYFKH